jgi:SAM-dependent methyltransferase
MAAEARQCPNVSSNHYDEVACGIISDVARAGGMVLDCGAGLRDEHHPHVVNLDIADYPSTDILATGQTLPFRDATFDAVFSLAVLEHVPDPFTCAAEIARVLKPGGRVYCVIPFLQPEHGYPSHFYNMTREGAANLFRGLLDIEEHRVPASGLPIWSLQWFLAAYAQSLPANIRPDFERMTVAELIKLVPQDHLHAPFVRGLPAETNFVLASTTAMLLRKPG